MVYGIRWECSYYNIYCVLIAIYYKIKQLNSLWYLWFVCTKLQSHVLHFQCVSVCCYFQECILSPPLPKVSKPTSSFSCIIFCFDRLLSHDESSLNKYNTSQLKTWWEKFMCQCIWHCWWWCTWKREKLVSISSYTLFIGTRKWSLRKFLQL